MNADHKVQIPENLCTSCDGQGTVQGLGVNWGEGRNKGGHHPLHHVRRHGIHPIPSCKKPQGLLGRSLEEPFR